ncbi:carboxymethylenebutenolidase [Stigmatella aurantiaca]|uniref:Carboxymethylenebutenolidase n=1 Tax=Stigmatella aurantiaca TaxID=41 RepID=A0A1H8F7K0_STIAU|nr:dienelactone hydrolase family protein [Stigmatella aurantiaca]SEN27364.1 carboxymethylenebutenolidase [Stigmatella aurantiaca]
MSTRLHYPRPDGQEAQGSLALPSSGTGGPSVVVLHEWWGLTGTVEQVTDRLAAEGYRALAVDYYRGYVASSKLEAMRKRMSLDIPDVVTQDVRGAAQYLKASGGKTAVLGFSLGGAVATMAACQVPEFDAGISFYGIPPGKNADPGQIRIPFQAHYGLSDDWYPVPQIDALEARMREGGVDVDFHRYEAKHGFFSTHWPEEYDAAAAEQAWGHLLRFLAARLRG